MDQLARVLASPTRIDLAREADFALGALKIRPSRCEVEAAGDRHVLQRRVMQVLVALAHSPSEVVSQQELISRCWGGLAVSDDAVGRCIGQLRRFAATWAEPPFEIATIAGVGYRLEASTNGAPARDATPPSKLRRFGAWIVLGAAAIAVALVAFLWRPVPRAAPVRSPTIAVLAFQPATGDAGAKSFAATLTTRVADAMSHYNVTVIAASPSLDPGKEKARPRAASGADFVVAGRVSEQGGRVTVTTDLSDPRDDILVYSFDTAQPRDAKGDVADAIANHVALSLDPTKFTNDLDGKLTPADFTLIARANDAIDRWDTADILDQSRKLAARHPRDGDLQASVAIAANFAAMMAPDNQKTPLLQLGRQFAAHAERLSPNSALLYIAKGMFARGPMSYARQEQMSRKALSLNPDQHVAYNGLGETMLEVGRTDEGVSLIKRSVQLDPMSGVVVGAAIQDLVKAGRRADAEQILVHQQQAWPDSGATVRLKYAIAIYVGTPQEVDALNAIYHPRAAGFGMLQSHSDLMMQAWRTRDPSAIGQVVSNCFADHGPSSQQLEDLDCLVEMVRLGRIDDAFRFSEIVYPDHRALYPVNSDDWVLKPVPDLDPSWLFLPDMQPFRADPRFWNVAVRTGLVDYWRSTGSWPDFCRPQLETCKRLATAAARAHPLPPTKT